MGTSGTIKKTRRDAVKDVLYHKYFDSADSVIAKWTPNNLKGVLVGVNFIYLNYYTPASVKEGRSTVEYRSLPEPVDMRDALTLDLLNSPRVFSNVEEIVVCTSDSAIFNAELGKLKAKGASFPHLRSISQLSADGLTEDRCKVAINAVKAENGSLLFTSACDYAGLAYKSHPMNPSGGKFSLRPAHYTLDGEKGALALRFAELERTEKASLELEKDKGARLKYAGQCTLIVNVLTGIVEKVESGGIDWRKVKGADYFTLTAFEQKALERARHSNSKDGNFTDKSRIHGVILLYNVLRGSFSAVQSGSVSSAQCKSLNKDLLLLLFSLRACLAKCVESCLQDSAERAGLTKGDRSLLPKPVLMRKVYDDAFADDGVGLGEEAEKIRSAGVTLPMDLHNNSFGSSLMVRGFNIKFMLMDTDAPFANRLVLEDSDVAIREVIGGIEGFCTLALAWLIKNKGRERQREGNVNE